MPSRRVHLFRSAARNPHYGFPHPAKSNAGRRPQQEDNACERQQGDEEVDDTQRGRQECTGLSLSPYLGNCRGQQCAQRPEYGEQDYRDDDQHPAQGDPAKVALESRADGYHMIERHGFEMAGAAVNQARIEKRQVRARKLAAAEFEACEGRAFDHQGRAIGYEKAIPAKMAAPTQLLCMKALKQPSRERSRIKNQ